MIGGTIRPQITGEKGNFFEWINAGHISIRGGQGSMFENLRPITAIHYGSSETHLYFRVHIAEDFQDDMKILFHITGLDEKLVLRRSHQNQPPPGGEVAFHELLEFSLGIEKLGIKPDSTLEFSLHLHEDDISIQRYPEQGAYTFQYQ